jgi:hypothetical protein
MHVSLPIARRRITMAIAATLIQGVTLVSLAQAQATTAPYNLATNLQAPANTLFMVGSAFNDLGQSAGSSYIKTGQSTKYYFEGGKLKSLVVDTFRVQATTWSAQGVPTALPPLSSGANAYVFGMSAAGVVVGNSYGLFDRTNAVAVAWRNGKVADLGAGSKSGASDVNASGLILGSRSVTSNYVTTTSYFTGKDKASLKWLTPLPSTVSDLYCMGLTDAGEVLCRGSKIVAGPSGASEFVYRGFVWANGSFTELVSPVGGQVLPFAVSRSGIVAGVVQVAGQADRAFVWQAGAWRWLPDLSAYGNAVTIWQVGNRGDVVLHAGPLGQDSTALVWNGQKYLEVSAIVPGRAANEVANVRKVNSQGQLLVELSSTVNGKAVSRFVVIAPQP